MRSVRIGKILLCFLFCVGSVDSQEPIRLVSENDEIRIGTGVYYFEDPTKNLSIEEITSPSYANRFKKSEKDPLNFGQTNWDYWIRIDFLNSESEPIRKILEVDYTNIDRIDFFSLDRNGRPESVETSGMSFPYLHRKTNHRNFIYNIDIEPKQERTYYLRTSTSGGLVLPLVVWNPKTFYHHNADIHLGLGFYYGIMVVMILYHFLIFLSVREIVYFYYVVNIFAFLGIQLVLTGHGFQYIWSNYPHLQRNLYVVFTAITMATLVLFAQRFLNTRKNVPIFLEHSLQFVFFCHVILFFTPLVLPPEITVKAALALSILAPALVLIAATVCFVKNYRPARYFLLAFTVLCVSGMFVVLKFANVIKVAGIADDGLYIGSAMSVILFSIALADKINILKKEKDEAQRKTFETQQKSLEMQKTLNDSLETLVLERTKIIEDQKFEIEKKAKIIEKDLDIAGKIQLSLLPSDLPRIPKIKIAYRCIPMLHVGGDFVDLSSDRTGRAVGMFICDVTGHGTGAAMVASMVKMALAEWPNYFGDPGHMLSKMRAQLVGKLNGNFLTATLITVYPESGRILIANAGHPETVILRKASGKRDLYRPSGMVINEFLTNPQYKSQSAELLPGDKVILYTDGLPEARSPDGEFFGDDRFLDLLQDCSALDPESFCTEVIRRIQAFTEEKQSSHDDMAIVVLEFTG